MKRFVSPELELICLDVVDVITASAMATPNSSKVPASSGVPAPTVSDAGLDNEVSADKWVFPEE